MLRESGVSALYLSWSFGVPGIYLGLPFRRSWPSHGGGPLTVAFTPGAACRAEGASVLYARGRLLSLALAPGGRQVPLVSSAWDSATRNAAAAVVNSGGSTPPAPPVPCQVTSQVIVAVAWNAPSGCPALEAA